MRTSTRSRKLLIALTSALVLASAAAADRARADVGLEGEVELGAVKASRNDVRIPGTSGTKLSLVDRLDDPVAPVFRARLGLRVARRHLLTALVAPLRLNATGRLDRDVRFSGAEYPAGSAVDAFYRFDSYRLTYRYSFLRDREFELAAGFTAKLREAEISLYGVEAARKTNTGFVPLLDLHVEWRPGAGRAGLLLDADALIAPQGRAEDVLLAFSWRLQPELGLYAGYRVLEGGADNDEVYNFSLLHYAVAGLRITLPGNRDQ